MYSKAQLTRELFACIACVRHCLIDTHCASVSLLNYRKKMEADKVTNRISKLDRLRFIEALCTDDVRDTYRLSQNVMTRSELENRNSSKRDPTFYEVITEKFNDKGYIPWTTPYPHLHADFSTAIILELTHFQLTPEKAKTIISDAKPFLYKMIDNYEKSGNGAMSRKDEEADWGTFDISLCNGEDDRSRYLQNENASYLLYWWQKLDEYSLLSFTCHHLPKNLTANTLNSPSISPLSSRNKSERGETSRILADNVRLVGQSMLELVACQTNEQIENLKDSKMNLELKVFECDEEKESRKVSCIQRRIEQLDKKITTLEEKSLKRQRIGSPSD